jgi:hypothetical protein
VLIAAAFSMYNRYLDGLAGPKSTSDLGRDVFVQKQSHERASRRLIAAWISPLSATDV